MAGYLIVSFHVSDSNWTVRIFRILGLHLSSRYLSSRYLSSRYYLHGIIFAVYCILLCLLFHLYYYLSSRYLSLRYLSSRYLSSRYSSSRYYLRGIIFAVFCFICIIVPYPIFSSFIDYPQFFLWTPLLNHLAFTYLTIVHAELNAEL